MENWKENPKAYTLIETGKENIEKVIDELKSYDPKTKNVEIRPYAISESETYGGYHEFSNFAAVAEIFSDSIEDTRDTITWKIRKIPEVVTTMTLMSIEDQHYKM